MTGAPAGIPASLDPLPHELDGERPPEDDRRALNGAAGDDPGDCIVSASGGKGHSSRRSCDDGGVLVLQGDDGHPAQRPGAARDDARPVADPGFRDGVGLARDGFFRARKERAVVHVDPVVGAHARPRDLGPAAVDRLHLHGREDGDRDGEDDHEQGNARRAGPARDTARPEGGNEIAPPRREPGERCHGQWVQP